MNLGDAVFGSIPYGVTQGLKNDSPHSRGLKFLLEPGHVYLIMFQSCHFCALMVAPSACDRECTAVRQNTHCGPLTKSLSAWS